MDSSNDLQARISRFRRLHEESPESRYFVPLADLLRQTGSYDEALELLDEGLATHPEYVAGLVIRGRTLLEVGKPEAAVGVWHQILGLDRDNVVALENLARLSMDDGDWDDAVPLMEQLCLQLGDDSNWSDLLAAAREKLVPAGEVSAALAGTDSGRGTPMDTLTLVDIYLAQGYQDRALDVLRRMLPDSGGSRPQIEERIHSLENGGTEPEGWIGTSQTAGGHGAGGNSAKRSGANDASRPLISSAERAAREKERSERRAEEQRQFEKWLETIRFNGSEGA